MPLLESTDQIAPRSVLRHRPIGNSKPPVTSKHAVVTTATTPVVQRASRPRADVLTEDMDDWRYADGPRTDSYPDVRLHTATNRIPKTLPSRPKTSVSKGEEKTKQHAHPLLYLGIGMLGMLMVWTIMTSASGWFTTTFDDLRYGRPRTFQTDELVGHNEQNGIPSHFIALNLHRHIEVIEIPGGDAAHAHIYVGPQLYGTNDELVPVTLKFVDINADQKKDMIVSFGASQVVFINDQGGFRPLLPSERDQVEQALKHLGH